MTWLTPSKRRLLETTKAEREAASHAFLRPDLSTVAKLNAFYASDEYRNMTTAEKCAVQGDGFINDYD